MFLNHPVDKFQREFISQYEDLMVFCDETMISEKSELLEKFCGESEEQKLTRRMSVTEILRQAWLNPIEALGTVLEFHGILLSYDLIRTVAISKKYEGYIKRSEDQFEKIKKMDTMRIDWEAIVNSGNVSFECKQRIGRIRPDTFGQLKLIEGIRPATLAVVAARAL